MNKFSNTESGFTLVEVLVSTGIMLIFLPFAASMMVNSQLLASYSKHKIEAAYLAQQTIEYQRQLPYSGSGSYNNFGLLVSIAPYTATLDTKGDYNNLTPSNHFMATVTTTVTPAAYTNSAGVKTTSNNVDHVVVSVSWNENILKLKVPMTETYAADIAADPMLN